MSARSREPVGVVLAGGRGLRLGGEKAATDLGGRPLVSYPVAAMRTVVEEVVVVAKRATRLPELSDVAVWEEPAEPHHPLVGILHALERAAGRAVLVCAADMPFVEVPTLAALARAGARSSPGVVAVSPGGKVQPLLGRYEPEAAVVLRSAAAEARLAMRTLVDELGLARLEVGEEELFNVNTPDDLAQARARLERESGRGPQPNVKS